jgi:hypothetical protein
MAQAISDFDLSDMSSPGAAIFEKSWRRGEWNLIINPIYSTAYSLLAVDHFPARTKKFPALFHRESSRKPLSFRGLWASIFADVAEFPKVPC